MKYDQTRYGRASRNLGGPAVIEDWQRADELNARLPEGSPRWVPIDTILPREDINPRRENARDAETVARYADVFDQLPPILVQAETFALIDGRHRLDAARVASRDHIRIIEVDLSDDELLDHAVKANVEHGRPATAKDRIYWAKDFLKRHPDWSPAKIGLWVGLSESAVRNHKRLLEAAAAARDVNVNVPADGDQVVQSTPPARITGIDGKSYPVRPPSGAAAPRVQSFDPDAESQPEPAKPDPWESHKRPASEWKTAEPVPEPDPEVTNGWGLPQTPVPIERGRERKAIDDLPDNDGEPRGETFVYLLDGFEVRVTVTSYVPDPAGVQAQRYAASVRAATAWLHGRADEIGETYGL